LQKTQEIVQIARKNKEFWQIPNNSNNVAAYGIKKMKGVQSERRSVLQLDYGTLHM